MVQADERKAVQTQIMDDKHTKCETIAYNNNNTLEWRNDRNFKSIIVSLTQDSTGCMFAAEQPRYDLAPCSIVRQASPALF